MASSTERPSGGSAVISSSRASSDASVAAAAGTPGPRLVRTARSAAAPAAWRREAVCDRQAGSRGCPRICLQIASRARSLSGRASTVVVERRAVIIDSGPLSLCQLERSPRSPAEWRGSGQELHQALGKAVEHVRASRCSQSASRAGDALCRSQRGMAPA